MAVKRYIRDYTKSERINKLSANAERLFVRLMMRCDDFGNFYADTKLIRSECFPLATAMRETDIGFALHELSPAIVRFYEADGKAYIHIIDFGQRLKWPTRKFPPCEFESPPKEKSNKKEKEVDVEKEGEGDLTTPAPVNIEMLKKQCIRFMYENCLKYFSELKANWNRAEASIAQVSISQDIYDDKIAQWKKNCLEPFFNAEFDKFFNYYSAKGWEVNDQPIVNKFSQFKVWLTRKK